MKQIKLFAHKEYKHFRRALCFIAVLLMVCTSGVPGLQNVRAQSIQDQIRALERENQQNRSIVQRLREEATSYEDAIKRLQAEIDTLQGQIDINISEQERLKKEIELAEAELARQQNLLGKNIRAMYVEGDVSTLVMLASSKDLSEFVDKQQYRNSVKNKIVSTLTKINELKHQLRGQKEQIDKLLKQQVDQQAQLASSRSEQRNLLSFNRTQQAEFNEKTKHNQNRIAELIAAQRRANDSASGMQFIRVPGAVRTHDSNIDDYPYKHYGHSQIDEPCPGPPRTADSTDRWGYCTRQCVSYVAWAIERSGRAAPRGWGDAKNWVWMAPSSWIVSHPAPGDIAVITAGTWGHVMYVERVEGSKILVSEYNQRLDGRYRNDRWLSIR